MLSTGNRIPPAKILGIFATSLFKGGKGAPRAVPITELGQTRFSSIYTFASDAIHINTDGKRMSVEWGKLLLAVWTRRALYLYVSPTKAFLLPRRQMQGHDEEILSYLKTFCPEKNRKISCGA